LANPRADKVQRVFSHRPSAFSLRDAGFARLALDQNGNKGACAKVRHFIQKATLCAFCVSQMRKRALAGCMARR